MDKRIASIIAKRNQLGWDVSKLAEEAGISATFILSIENGDESLKRIIADWEKLISQLHIILDKAIKTTPKQPTRTSHKPKANKQITSIINMRKQLGWTIKELAEEAGLPYREVLRVERDGISHYTYVSRLAKVLNKALEVHKPRYLKTSLLDYLEDQGKWSRNYERCVKCGTTEKKHRGHGLCEFCYRKHTEKKQKAHKRKRGIAGKKLTKEYLLDEYWVNQKSLNDIAKDCVCTRQYVYKKLKQYEIPTRSKKSARSVALKRGKLEYNRIDEDGIINVITLQKVNVNENFFSAWSNEMAWVLGLIFSDGNLVKNQPRFHIDQKDPEILEQIKSLMNCNAKLMHKRKRTYKGIVSGETYRLQIYNQKVYDDLIGFGLTPDKSLNINFPKIPLDCMRHFIRGCWDGDGSVFIDNQSGHIRASYISGSINFIKGMLNKLERADFPKRTIYKTRSKTPSYYFRFYGEQCKKLYHFFYDDVPQEQYLERKHKVFEDYFGVLLKQK